MSRRPSSSSDASARIVSAMSHGDAVDASRGRRDVTRAGSREAVRAHGLRGLAGGRRRGLTVEPHAALVRRPGGGGRDRVRGTSGRGELVAALDVAEELVGAVGGCRRPVGRPRAGLGGRRGLRLHRRRSGVRDRRRDSRGRRNRRYRRRRMVIDKVIAGTGMLAGSGSVDGTVVVAVAWSWWSS